MHADLNTNWDDWDDAHGDVNEPTKLAVLREYIVASAREQVTRGNITAEWANKKLSKLGITETIPVNSLYVIRQEATGTVEVSVYASDRTSALASFANRLADPRGVTARSVVVGGTPEFVSGPEDAQPEVGPDAPQTVDATLAALRETVMLAIIAGPRVCEHGANEFLGEYGLPPVPERKTFKVSRPVQAVMETEVQAYDPASAQRVASWRWDNDRSGFTVTGGDPLGDVAVTAS